MKKFLISRKILILEFMNFSPRTISRVFVIWRKVNYFDLTVTHGIDDPILAIHWKQFHRDLVWLKAGKPKPVIECETWRYGYEPSPFMSSPRECGMVPPRPPMPPCPMQ